MRKQPTGEPYAGDPHVRFGGRGGESLPYPYRAGSRNLGQGKLQEKPGRRFPRHSGREAGSQGRESQRRRSSRHSGREAGILGRESNLAVTIGAKVARPLTVLGLGPGFPAGTTKATSFRPGSRNPVPWKAAPQSPEAPKPDRRLRAAVGQGQREGGRRAPLPGIR